MSVPELVIELGRARVQARADKNFALADQIRDQIAAAGYEIIDVAGGIEFREKSLVTTLETIRGVKPFPKSDRLATVAIVVNGFHEDAIATIESIKKNSSCEIAVLVTEDAIDMAQVVDNHTHLISLATDPGWGECVNSLLKSASTKYVVVMDPSTHFTGDAITPVVDVLERGEFVAAGWHGGLVNLEDQWRSVEDKGAGEVDVLFSYFMALDKEAAINAGSFNSRAIFYRNADIEFSLKLRHAGGRLLQMDLPLEQGRHHGYHDTDPEYRDAQSKKTFDRILERFRGKEAILSPRR